MSDQTKDPFKSLDDLDDAFPVPPSARQPAKPTSAPVDHFPDDGDDDVEEAPVERAVPRRSPLARSRQPVEAQPEDDMGFDDGDEHGEVHGSGAYAADDGFVDEEHDGRGGHDRLARPGDAGDEGDEGDEGAYEDEGEEKPRVDLKKYGIYGAMLAAALGVGGLGYTYVSSMFSPAPAQQTAGGPAPVAPLSQQGQQYGGLPPGVARAGGQPPMLPGAQTGGRTPVLPPSIQAPQPFQSQAPQQAAQPAPRVAAPVAPVYQPQPETPAQPAVQVQPSAPSVDKADFDRLVARFASLEGKLNSLATRQDVDQRLHAVEDRVASVEARAVAPTTPRPVASVPDKPRVVQGWTLKGVAKGVAWLMGPSGFVQATVGQDLDPVAGTVKAISKYNDDWVVMTSTGVIMRK